MSGNSEAFKLTEDDVIKFLACQTHVGAANMNFQMEQYIWKRASDGAHIINLKRTWEKLLLAARAIAAIENPNDICVISARPYAQRAILKFGAHTGANAIAGRFTPGTFTNQIQKAFKEPRLLIVSDPRIDHQAVTEASYVNIPVIAFCNTDSPMRFIDIAIPCNNKGKRSVGLMWWMLAREVLIIRGKISRQIGFELENKTIMPDLYFYRDPEEEQKDEAGEGEAPDAAAVRESDHWGQAMDAQPHDDFASTAGVVGGSTGGVGVGLDFNAPVVQDWAQETQQFTAGAAQAAHAQSDWGGGNQQSWK